MKKKTDKDMVSKELWELDYLQKTYNVSRDIGRIAIKAVGNSRKKVMAWLKENNFIKSENETHEEL